MGEGAEPTTTMPSYHTAFNDLRPHLDPRRQNLAEKKTPFIRRQTPRRKKKNENTARNPSPWAILVIRTVSVREPPQPFRLS